MGSSNLFLSFSLSKLILLLALLTPTISAANSNHFTEYIGASFNGVAFTDVPINPNVDFHFILAFAIDYTGGSSPAPTNGQFNIFWDSNNLSPSAVAAIKQSNPNVKVAVSLGGATVSGQPVNFSPTSVDSWVSNAVSSLTSIIQQYNLDGIDVDYENFQSDPSTFTQCIGQLITTLKQNGVISFASIAPFDNSDVQTHYQALWASFGSVIDYVNFQFYAYGPSTTVDQYLSHYNDQTANYNGGTILASFTTDNSPNSLSADTGLSACESLHAEGSLPGIFIWSADDSKSEGFTYETQAQALLTS
ncbi:chitinase 2-like [Ananas comosus]|uniref:Chitinase 2-like n=1 Tax=Ananas comosus TaxID=4615 RepID=A0A6P5GDN8_ANACO|nr:chitinase 2-like [Ananas comosus]